MKYDFTTIMDRRGRDAIAVDSVGKIPGFAPEAPAEGFDLIPMWVADMNFPTAPSITEALHNRIDHPAFGYFSPTDEYYDAIIRWQTTRNGVKGLTKDCIGYENGVLGGLVSALRVMCSPGDNVLVHTPTYIGFTNTLRNNGWNIVHTPLVPDGDGVPRMDYDDMEKKLRDKHIHAAILCSPHNPCGRVWEREELERAYALFKKYDVRVVSDEIWSDLILAGHTHIPSQSISDDARHRTVALYAPSKTFNLAGLVGSYHIIYDRTLRDRIRKESSLSHYNEMNVLSMHALTGAYSPEGAQWVDELRSPDPQRPLCRRIHPRQFPRRLPLRARGHLHALSRLRTLVPHPRQDPHRTRTALLARRRRPPGRSHVQRPVEPPHQPRPPRSPGPRSHEAPGCICLQ